MEKGERDEEEEGARNQAYRDRRGRGMTNWIDTISIKNILV